MSEEPGTAVTTSIGELMLDRPVPGFSARSTQGPVSMDDFRGKWVILFSHPADFTPVCTSEFIALQNAHAEFELHHCVLLGLSVDSVYSHVAWVRNIREKFGIQITFPIIEDISMSISRAYGMLDHASDSTSTVRAVFFIDPEGILRARIHYPMQVGRNVGEILRTLCALQATDTHDMTAPENWQPGDSLVQMAPTTVDEAEAAISRPGCAEWYFTTPKQLN